VSTEADLNSAIQAIDATGADAATNTAYTIDITEPISLTSDLLSLNLPSGVNLTIEGSNGAGGSYAIDGGGKEQGFVSIEKLVERDGVNGFRQSLEARLACCATRKIEPLARALAGASTWITGLRAESRDPLRHYLRITSPTAEKEAGGDIAIGSPAPPQKVTTNGRVSASETMWGSKAVEHGVRRRPVAQWYKGHGERSGNALDYRGGAGRGQPVRHLGSMSGNQVSETASPVDCYRRREFFELPQTEV